MDTNTNPSLSLLTKKIWILILFFLVCLGVLGFYFFSQIHTQSSSFTQEEVPEYTPVDISFDQKLSETKTEKTEKGNASENTELTQLLLQKNSTSSHGHSSDSVQKTVSDDAVVLDKCVHITDFIKQQNCHDKEYLEKAVKSSKIFMCDAIVQTSYKGDCKNTILLNVAKESRDFSLCEKMTTGTLQKKCFEEKNRAIFSHAHHKSDCDKITEKSLQEQCSRKFLNADDFRFSPVKCRSLPEGFERVLCEKMTISSALSEQNHTLDCHIFSGEVSDFCTEKKQSVQDEKWYHQALEKSQYRYCQKISQKNMAIQCKDSVLYNQVWKQKDGSLCNLIVQSDTKIRCENNQIPKLDKYFYHKAMRTKDKLICLKIFNREMQEKCIGYFSP